MSKKKNNQDQDQNSSNDSSQNIEIEISNKPTTTPAEEKAPDQSILDKPKPKPGVSMMKSWKHAGSRK